MEKLCIKKEFENELFNAVKNESRDFSLRKVKYYFKNYQGIIVFLLSGVAILFSTLINYWLFIYKSSYYKYFNIELQDIVIQDGYTLYSIALGIAMFIMLSIEIIFLVFILKSKNIKGKRKVFNVILICFICAVVNAFAFSYILFNDVRFTSYIVAFIFAGFLWFFNSFIPCIGIYSTKKFLKKKVRRKLKKK